MTLNRQTRSTLVLSISVLGVVVSALLSYAVVAAGAAETGPQLYSCKSVGPGKGQYEDSFCRTSAKGGSFESSRLSAEPSQVRTASGTPFVLTQKVAGVVITTKCLSEAGSGNASNQEGRGRLGSTQFTFSRCQVEEPRNKGCKIKGEGFSTNPLVARAEATEPVKTFKYAAERGTVLFSLTIERCAVTALNGTYPFTGSLESALNPSTSMLEFLPSSGLSWGGNPASLVGNTKIETVTGEALALR